MCKFLAERQKSTCFISRYGLACLRAPRSRDYALELVDGQENKLLAKNYKCYVSDRLGVSVWDKSQEALLNAFDFLVSLSLFLQGHVI